MNENENEKDMIDAENEAGSISPQTDAKATINEIKVELDKENSNLKIVNEEDIQLIKVNEEVIESNKTKETNDSKETNKGEGEGEGGVKESSIENETLLIPADREEPQTETKTETLEDEQVEEGNFVSDNLPILSVGVIAIALIVTLVFKKMKK